MNNVLVTGSNGFIGKNLIERLKRCKGVGIKTFDIEDDLVDLTKHLKDVDIIFHLAGVNRPEKIEEFETVNAGLTQTIVDILEKLKRNIPVVLSSSIYAMLDSSYGKSKKQAEDILHSSYGKSKKQAEDILLKYSKKNNAKVYIYRFPHVFGKWCRPNYNSVIATFCYNIAHDQEITISDVNNEINMVYIDDVVDEFAELLIDNNKDNRCYREVKQTFKITLGELASKLYELRDIRKTLIVPDLSDRLMKCLHATYLSYLGKDDFSYKLNLKTDKRGVLAELIKSKHFGQIFVSTSHNGIIRGNHYHNSKIEKFCVLKGKAVIKFRHILEEEVLSYYVSGDNLEVVDIPPGYTHSIENLGDSEIIVLFWANQIFNPEKPDTYYCEV